MARSGLMAETDRFFGACLRQERLLAGHDRAMLAVALGISVRRLADYEAGRRRMTPAAMVSASETLGVPLSVLFYGCGDARAPDSEDDVPARIAVARPLSLIQRPAFDQLARLLDIWRSSRGHLPSDIGAIVASEGLQHRMVFVRQPRGSSRLIVEYLGAGIELFRPCESLLLVGRDIEDRPDPDYGIWVAKTYARVLADEMPALESARARIYAAPDRLIEGRYDRFLLPWFGAGGERFVLCISLTRSSRVLAPAGY